MGYIYCYKVEGEVKYVGQTCQKTVNGRHSHHICVAFKPDDKEYEYPLSRAIRKYGKDRVKLEILEQDVPSELLDDREIYWIKYYDTYCNGYNQNPGGKQYQGHRLPDEILLGIKEMLKKQYSRKYIAQHFKVSDIVVADINAGRSYYESKDEYPLDNRPFKNNASARKVSGIKEAIKNTTYTLLQISEFYEVPYAWVKAINKGDSCYDANEHYPLREFLFFRQNLYNDGRPNLVRIDKLKIEAFYNDIEAGQSSKTLYQKYGEKYAYDTFVHLCSKMRSWLKERKIE